MTSSHLSAANSHAKLKKTKSKSKFKIFFRNKINTLKQGVLEKPKQLDELDYPEDYVAEIPFLKDIYESYTEVYKPVKRLSKSQLETKRNLKLCSQCLEHSGEDIRQGDMSQIALVLESLGGLYDGHCDDLQQVVNDMEVLSTNALRVMNTRADYKQSLVQHNFKKKQYEQLKNSVQMNASSANMMGDMQRRAKAEDDMYTAERYMNASYEDVMSQMHWLKEEAHVKYPNTLKKLCRSYRTLFEKGLEQLKQIEEHLSVEDESAIIEPAETRKGLEVQRRNASHSHHVTIKENKLFGVPLEEVMSRPEETHDIPIVVEQIIEYIEDNLDTEGIFRIPASTSKLNAYIKRADLGMPLHLENEHIPHTVCGLLKKYLRMLPDSLLTHGLYNEFVDLMHVSDEDRFILIEELFLQLPLHHQKLLLRILLLMRRVVEHSEINKMNQNNTVVVFAPNLLYIEDENPLRVAQSTPQIVYVTNLLLKNFDRLWEISGGTFLNGGSTGENSSPDEDTQQHERENTYKRVPPPVPKKLADHQLHMPERYEDSKSELTSTCTEQTPQTTESATTTAGTSSFFTSTTSTQFVGDTGDQCSSVDSSFDSSMSKSRRSGYRFRTYNFDEEQLRASLEHASMLSSSQGSSSPDEESVLHRRSDAAGHVVSVGSSIPHDVDHSFDTSPQEEEEFLETALPVNFEGEESEVVTHSQETPPLLDLMATGNHDDDGVDDEFLHPQAEVEDFPGVEVTESTPLGVEQDEDLLRFE
uniref:Rho-GAP domain-containing protein n=1 Tax=Percolomonas cosmopolitus TaxID=63605 RepID=A0A7S1KQY4_9EUKA|mmetsp:Transcript_5812/g.22055  ORF Transcript_5812/g.22055 Transcript_5812/m.22055 type:complete len:756 (+) Transcript_5812:507-2774(+)|eukprot:CAMPEP_0117449448 /NCGR_PEP_ID=MMETSP0759-20121206/7951_1 /TAXON_ID=63605 /ORGANISM="Percolomonas cosmopolitus, Strain WS" /LENGTH=755 /DNA_ID=CAMNT_0005241925 /DNA_START=492 /DNA_END=2759 /DNA_ORIENTATION=-